MLQRVYCRERAFVSCLRLRAPYPIQAPSSAVCRAVNKACCQPGMRVWPSCCPSHLIVCCFMHALAHPFIRPLVHCAVLWIYNSQGASRLADLMCCWWGLQDFTKEVGVQCTADCRRIWGEASGRTGLSARGAQHPGTILCAESNCSSGLAALCLSSASHTFKAQQELLMCQLFSRMKQEPKVRPSGHECSSFAAPESVC